MAGRSIDQIQRALDERCGVHRSAWAIGVKAGKERISLKWRDYATGDVQRLFRVSKWTVRAWITTGHLEAYRWFSDGQSHHWLVTETALVAFLRNYPWLYESGQMDQTHHLFLVARTVNRAEEWLNPKQVGKLVGRSEDRIRALAKQGVLPFEKRGVLFMFRRSQLDIVKAAFNR